MPSRKSINAAFLQLIGGTGEALSHNSQAAFFASALRCHAWDKWWVQMSDSDIFSSSFEQWLVPGFHRLGRTLMELASIPLDDEAPSKTLPPPPPPLPPPPSKRTRAAAEAALTETLRNQPTYPPDPFGPFTYLGVASLMQLASLPVDDEVSQGLDLRPPLDLTLPTTTTDTTTTTT